MSAENNKPADDSDVVSLVDVLAAESRMQEDASAVLGGSDDQNCTYPKGYVQRQALYACSTCSPCEPAGICLACSYHCHGDHDLIELYTKRNFRCDCGNSKFGTNKCKLVQTKDDVNSENQYNHNFKGTYCLCARPYPDPEDEVEDSMIQCVMCEDWYHGRHLNADVPDNDDYQEMICMNCMNKYSFLWAYQVSSPAVKVEKDSTGDEVDVSEDKGAVSNVKAETLEAVNGEQDCQLAQTCSGTESAAAADQSHEDEPAIKRRKTEEQNEECDKHNTSEEPCLLRDLQKRDVAIKNCATFWQEGWREKLCKCSVCLDMYKKEEIEFLLDKEDTVGAYEEKGQHDQGQGPSVLEQEQMMLSSMDHVQKIEMIQGFNDMTSQLRDFFKGFAESGQVVGEEDIKVFFARMHEKRKERRANLQMQYHCK